MDARWEDAHTYKNGDRLYRRADGIRADVLSKRAREVVEQNAAKDRPPHQTNVYEMYDNVDSDDEYTGFLQEEEDQLAEIARGFYVEMVDSGLSENEATQRAWVMAQTRGTGQIREARESAKPYDKDRSKGKGKEVRFKESDERPAAPEKRFPPPSVMPPQPMAVPAPVSNAWPRQTNPKSNPIITPPPVQMPGRSSSMPVPEIDMTSKRSAPTMRFTSDVEDSIDIEGAVNHIFDEIKLSMNLTHLLALSPAMRKHLAEITKTKRVPTTNVSREKKVMAMFEGGDDETTFNSLPIIETAERLPRYSGSLPKVQAEINGALAVGMLDTGSQINLMTEEFWMKTGLPINEGRKIRMQGVNLTGDQSIGLCELVEVPFAGVTTRAHFHVFRKAPYPFIQQDLDSRFQGPQEPSYDGATKRPGLPGKGRYANGHGDEHAARRSIGILRNRRRSGRGIGNVRPTRTVRNEPPFPRQL